MKKYDCEELLTTGGAGSDPLMTGSDVARLAGVSSATVRLWAEGGRLRCIRTTSGIRLYDRTDVERFLHQRRPLTLGGLGGLTQ